ncbi:hypothetical protein ACCAA_10129 [Candidatus Accumulibacter aalborgensis]|uniref:Uncharacterized protein n=1 Tax=Candidatus Accumulibacter aalborgensis TaxID=1860102 RepID=A0A1A8XDB9_9PROT|nr:hypothetical protein ACCAA_10129 [Candidatus Accumulibacter aalborgensis]
MTNDDRRCRQFLCDLCRILDIIVDSEPVKPLAALAVTMARKVQRVAVESSVVEIGQKILVPTARRGVNAMDKDQRRKRRRLAAGRCRVWMRLSVMSIPKKKQRRTPGFGLQPGNVPLFCASDCAAAWPPGWQVTGAGGDPLSETATLPGVMPKPTAVCRQSTRRCQNVCSQ